MEAEQRTPAWLWIVGGLFVVVMGGILVASVSRPELPMYAVSRIAPRDVPTGPAGPDTVTLDARSGDAWVLFDLERRAMSTDPRRWDIGAKRHRLVVNGGEGFAGNAGVRILGEPFAMVVAAPAGGYRPSRVTPGGDTVNAVLEDWYSYSFFSHLLEPVEPATFVIRTTEGRHAKLRVLSYYCPGPEAGCLTLEYALLP